jgi:hypothetical protein
MMTQPTTIDRQAQHELLGRLRAVRRTGVVVAALAGASQAILAVLAGGLVAISLDWLLRLPGPLRLLVLLALAVLAAVVLSRCVIARLRLQPLAQIARQVQDTVSGPPDCLASGTEFALDGMAGTFAAQTISRSAHLSRALSPVRLARWRWMSMWLAGAVLAAVVLAAVWPAVGWWIECGLGRLAWPVTQADWPRRTQILSDLSGQTLLAAAGEPVDLEARIVRGAASTPARVVLEDSGQVRRLEMTDTGDGQRSVAPRLLSSITFWFEAGDDNTRATPGRVRVVPRPAVSRAEILVQPPAYTAESAARITLGSGPVQVAEGSRIDLHVTVSKPLASEAGHARATIVLAPADSPDAQPVEVLDVRFTGTDHQLTAGWWCTRDSLVRIDFTDTDNFANAPLQPWRIAATIDQPPAIQISSPADAIEVAPAAVVSLQATATDDHGVDDVRLVWQVAKTGAPASQPSALPEQLRRIPTSQPQRNGQTVSLTIDSPWTLADLSLEPGDKLTWSLQAQDNFDLAGRRHEPTRSPPRTIRIVSEATLLESVLQQLADARSRIVQMRRQQQDLRETLQAQARGERAAPDPVSQQRSLEQQAQIAREARDTAAALTAAAQRIRANRVQRESLADSVAAASRQLSQIQSKDMADVQRNLQASPPSMDSASQSADAAAKELEALLRQTAGWTSLESAALGLQDLLDKQRGLQEQTADLAAQTLGQPIDQLAGAQREALGTLAQDQRGLSDRLTQLQKDMRTQAQAADAPASDRAKLTAATKSLDKQNAASDMATSADQIARNVTMDAQQRQHAARQAMQQALAALRGENPNDQAGADTDMTDALARQLKDLAQRQTTLRAQTGDINARRSPAGSLDRAGHLRLSQASQAQSDLGKQVDQAQQAVPGEAAQRLLAAVAGRMQETSQQMQTGSSGQPVLDSQQHAAQTLSALADALERAARDKQNRNLAGGKQGDPEASGAKQPKASEVEALYLLQQDLLLRTQHVSENGAAKPAVQQLAQEQQQIRDLAQRVLSEQ